MDGMDSCSVLRPPQTFWVPNVVAHLSPHYCIPFYNLPFQFSPVPHLSLKYLFSLAFRLKCSSCPITALHALVSNFCGFLVFPVALIVNTAGFGPWTNVFIFCLVSPETLPQYQPSVRAKVTF